MKLRTTSLFFLLSCFICAGTMLTPLFAVTPLEYMNGFTKNQLSLIDDFFEDGAVLEDPFVHVEGKEAIKKYYLELFENVLSIHYEFLTEVRQGDEHFISWVCQISHRRLNGGEPLTVEGSTHYRYSPKSKKVIYQRDYFDTGPTIYENIPLLGWFIRKLRGQIRNESIPQVLK